MSAIPKELVDLIAARGRYGDTHLLHISGRELASLERTGRVTRNPDTGLPEAFSFGQWGTPAGEGVTGSFGSMTPQQYAQFLTGSGSYTTDPTTGLIMQPGGTSYGGLEGGAIQDPAGPASFRLSNGNRGYITADGSLVDSGQAFVEAQGTGLGDVFSGALETIGGAVSQPEFAAFAGLTGVDALGLFGGAPASATPGVEAAGTSLAQDAATAAGAAQPWIDPTIPATGDLASTATAAAANATGAVPTIPADATLFGETPGAGAAISQDAATAAAATGSPGIPGVPGGPQPWQEPTIPPIGGSPAGDLGATSAGTSPPAVPPSLIDKALKLVTGNPLAIGATVANLLAQRRASRSASQVPQELRDIAAPLQTAGQDLLNQYRAGTIPAGAAFDIDQWVQQSTAQAQQYWDRAGLGTSSMATQQIGMIKAKADAMRELARQGLLTAGLQAYGMAIGPLTNAVQAQMQQDTALMQAQSGALSSLLLIMALGTTPKPTTP